MPANLTPEYLAAEKKFRQAKSPEEKLECLQEMLATIPKHKGTEKMQADIRRKISKFKGMVEAQRRRQKRGFAFRVDKEGAGQVVLVGPPNAGKSLLLSRLTNAIPEVAEYPYTTTVPMPGMMQFEDIKIQLVDLPPFSPEHTENWALELVRGADAVLLVFDFGDHELLEYFDFIITRLERAKLLLVREEDPEIGPPYIQRRTLLVANKCDLPHASENMNVFRELYDERFPLITLSALSQEGLEQLPQHIFRTLNVVRIYAKEPGEKPDFAAPFVLEQGSTVLDLAREIHKDFAATLRYARIWGGARFDGQIANRDYLLQDKDIVELHLDRRG